MKINNIKRRFINYMAETYKNKIAAIAIIGLSMVPCLVDKDATCLTLAIFVGVPLFLVNKNCVY